MKIEIKVPYYSQWDNKLHPGGSCNLTSAAMVLAHYGLRPKKNYGYSRLPDQLLAYCDDTGRDRHTLETIDHVLEINGVHDLSSYNGSFQHLKAHLKMGNIAIVHGEFTGSGHIVVVCGFDEIKGRWLCNDPAGKWPHYDGYTSGERVWYEAEWFRQKAAPDGKIWLHLLAKKK